MHETEPTRAQDAGAREAPIGLVDEARWPPDLGPPSLALARVAAPAAPEPDADALPVVVAPPSFADAAAPSCPAPRVRRRRAAMALAALAALSLTVGIALVTSFTESDRVSERSGQSVPLFASAQRLVRAAEAVGRGDVDLAPGALVDSLRPAPAMLWTAARAKQASAAIVALAIVRALADARTAFEQRATVRPVAPAAADRARYASSTTASP